MPPAGAPRPDQATYERVATFLETALDRAAAATPNPGSLPLLHRLSRTEYQNAVRDLLALDALPQEMDYLAAAAGGQHQQRFRQHRGSALRLADDDGALSRRGAERSAASRWAIPAMPPMVNIHRLHPEQWQDARVDELPIGTRGGLAVRSYFPVDGDYIVKLDVAGAGRDAHQIEITVDDERVQLTTVGGAGRGGAAGAAAAAGTPGAARRRTRWNSASR